MHDVALGKLATATTASTHLTTEEKKIVLPEFEIELTKLERYFRIDDPDTEKLHAITGRSVSKIQLVHATRTRALFEFSYHRNGLDRETITREGRRGEKVPLPYGGTMYVRRIHAVGETTRVILAFDK